VIRKVPAGRKVEGRTVMESVDGEWFRCRLTLPSANQTPDAASGARKVVREPMLLWGLRDLSGDPVELTVENRVEVNSRELGRAVWDVQAEPEPLRRRRRLLGYQTTLRRVIVHERQES
jgi:hypothetical protein